MEEKKMAMNRLSDRLPSLLDRFLENDMFDWSSRHYSDTNTTLPSVNIKESQDDFEVEVAAPGLTKNDFRIELDHDHLTVSSERKDENETVEGQHFTLREFSYQSFCRSFKLPNTADSEKIGAKYENGILRIVIPKKEEAKPKLARTIEIK